jgi:hypothetical protein
VIDHVKEIETAGEAARNARIVPQPVRNAIDAEGPGVTRQSPQPRGATAE